MCDEGAQRGSRFFVFVLLDFYQWWVTKRVTHNIKRVTHNINWVTHAIKRAYITELQTYISAWTACARLIARVVPTKSTPSRKQVTSAWPQKQYFLANNLPPPGFDLVPASELSGRAHAAKRRRVQKHRSGCAAAWRLEYNRQAQKRAVAQTGTRK